MSDDLNLPASLQRLEITPERQEISCEVSNAFPSASSSKDQPERFLENLSLKAVCSKGNCQCNKKKDNKEEDDVLKKLKRTQRRPLLRRSRLNSGLLRAPVLKLQDIKSASPATEKSQTQSEAAGKSDSYYASNLLSEEVSCGEGRLSQTLGKSLLRAPVLRVASQSTLPVTLQQSSRTSSEDSLSSLRAPAMCAVQARNPPSDDTNIEELASYFDLLVHIPKKMSVMAEMMYI